MPASSEELGRAVREAWIEWAEQQPNPKPSWLIPWEELDPGQKEVDMKIGERLYNMGANAQMSAFRRELYR